MILIYKLAAVLSLTLLFPPVTSCDQDIRMESRKDLTGIYVVSVVPTGAPFFTTQTVNDVATISINCSSATATLGSLIIRMENDVPLEYFTGATVKCSGSDSQLFDFAASGNVSIKGKEISLTGSYHFTNGDNILKISLISNNLPLTGKYRIENIELRTSEGAKIPIPYTHYPVIRVAMKLRSAGQDNVNTWRIPGLITTNRGTIIAVYDVRYNNSGDLQENIDIGMSRSRDGGETWEAMKVIMDMGEYGGLGQERNGMGDPCILYDNYNDVIWVASLWMNGGDPGKALWFASQPGMSPRVTGQFMLVKSSDDGLTWSQPENITPQIKNPDWQLLLQGPGRGITMKNGTLVFPAQFKSDLGVKAIDGGRFTCQSTIVFSSDAGRSWKIGTGAKTNTTEAQVVELSDGSLMLNMRDDRNRSDKSATNGRAVSVTRDMGTTWDTHPSSNRLLPEPNCMAGLLAADLLIEGHTKKILFFSNPANREKRSDMTIKASMDEGFSWPEKNQVVVDRREGYGYSCLTMIDANYLGILYEGIKELYFMKIPVSDLLTDYKRSRKK